MACAGCTSVLCRCAYALFVAFTVVSCSGVSMPTWSPEEGSCSASQPGGAKAPDVRSVGDANCVDVLKVLSVGEASRMDGVQPAVILNVIEHASWDVRVFFGGEFNKTFGSVQVEVFTAAEAALFGGVGDRFMTISMLLDRMRDLSKAPVYAFDTKFFSGDAQAAGVLPVPSALELSEQIHVLSLGGRGAGTQFHTHGAAYLTLLTGQKRWYIQRKGKFPRATARAMHRSVGYWEREVYPHLGENAPQSCVQRAGETIFVPSGWAHATINIDETLGVAWQTPVIKHGSCEFGNDYFCLSARFRKVRMLESSAEQGVTFRKLYRKADKLTAGMSVYFWDSLQSYWKADEAAGLALYREMKSTVLRLLAELDEQSGEVFVAARLAKRLADIVWAVTVDVKEMESLLLEAAAKAPEVGAHRALAQVCGMQRRFDEAVAHLKSHLQFFPHDEKARQMLSSVPTA